MILSVDIGTSSLKAALISMDGRVQAHVRIPYRDSWDDMDGDFDPRRWEDAFRQALDRLPRSSVSILALCGNGPTLVPCKMDGSPVGPALLWLQNQTIPAEKKKSYYLPKAAWFRKNRSSLWSQTRRVFSGPEWLHFRLTGAAVTVFPNESFIPYIWDEEQISVFGFDSSFFPEMTPMGTITGRISRETAAKTGLKANLPVAVVGSDFVASLLGTDSTKPGRICDRAGTSEGLNYCSSIPAKNPHLRTLPHAVEGLWNVAFILSSTGAMFEWFRRFTGQDTRRYSEMLSDINLVPPGLDAPLFFPNIHSGSPYEFSGGKFENLDPSHTPSRMGRSVMEAIGYAVREGVEILEREGLPVQELRVCGGQARGDVWNQMKADITGCRLLIPKIKDAELAGCAACAAAAMGRFETPLEAAGRYMEVEKIIEPRSEFKGIYDEAYRRYQELTKNMLT